jgi:proline iminopeptidase
MDVIEGYLPFEGYQTYYRILSPLGKKTPLLLLHGGPGGTHNSFEILDSFLCDCDRPVIFYDQLGCGKSSVKDSHPELWTMATWKRELANLRQGLGLSSVHILGHSFGGMLALNYALEDHPSGIASLILSSTLSSSSLWEKETHRLIRYLSSSDQEAIQNAFESGNYSSLEYKNAEAHYLAEFVGGAFGSDSLASMLFSSEPYQVAWGPSEFRPLGNLKDYDCTGRLGDIMCPTLLLSGTDDESTPFLNKTMYDALRCMKRWILLDGLRHRTYSENPKRYADALMEFLVDVEKKGPIYDN